MKINEYGMKRKSIYSQFISHFYWRKFLREEKFNKNSSYDYKWENYVKKWTRIFSFYVIRVKRNTN